MHLIGGSYELITAYKYTGKHNADDRISGCHCRFLLVFFIRPQRKEERKKSEMLAQLAVGDSVLTSSGFYGIVIDISDDTVIVEFGNNKNCRIPMQKAAIVQIEKPEDASDDKSSAQ